ncbi:MAG: hypothetical protein ABSH50_10035 [Bryobacteraceae bacterium]|jgi:cell division protein FtsL
MGTLATFFRRPPMAAVASGAPSNRFDRTYDGAFRLRALPNEDVFLYSKRIDNSRIVLQPQSTSRREWSAIGALGAAALAFMILLTPRVANVVTGYQLESLKQENQRLLDEQRELDLTVARLSREENLNALAKQRDLGMPGPGQVFHLDPKGDAKLALNRH